MKINYVTTNKLKFAIAEQFFSASDEHTLVQYALETPEIQSKSCEEIASFSAIHAAQEIGEPCVVVDAGFFISALGGFPGPFVKYTNEWLSEKHLLRMLDATDDRSAYFLDVLAVGFPDGHTKTFPRKVEGHLARDGEYTLSHWPANSLFIPDGYTKPLGSMSEQEQKDFWQNTNWSRLIEYISGKG